MLETEVMEHLPSRWAAECFALCQKMQVKIPRELRDIVYEHTLENPRSILYSKDLHCLRSCHLDRYLQANAWQIFTTLVR
jgi:hypothetical protein